MQCKYLMHHFEHHAVSGDCQLRLYTDIILLDDSIFLNSLTGLYQIRCRAQKKNSVNPAYKARISFYQSKVPVTISDR